MGLLFCALALAACAREGPAPRPAAAAPAAAVPAAGADSLRGRVRVTGSEPGVTFVLVDAAGAAVALQGDRRMLERLSGVEVVVRGTRAAPAFRVESLSVRASGGVAAVDGILAREGGRDLLVLHDGARRVVARLPEPLRGRTGARVWLAGPLDGDIASFGVITNAP